jgi:hypothetical protein
VALTRFPLRHALRAGSAVVDVGCVDAAACDAGHVVLCIVGQGDVLAAVDAPNLIMGLTDYPVREAHDACFRPVVQPFTSGHSHSTVRGRRLEWRA